MAVGASAYPRDGRRSTRSRSLLGAYIQSEGPVSSIGCIVRNVSDDGARLTLTDGALVPNEFDLVLLQRGSSRRVRLAWRGDNAMGVEFLPSDASVRSQADRDTLQALNQENAALLSILRDLTLRLESLGISVEDVLPHVPDDAA